MSPDAKGNFKGLAVPANAPWPYPPLTTEEVAEWLRISPATVASYCRSGKLRASRLGNTYRIRHDAVEEFLDTLAVRPETTVKNGGKL